MISRTILVGMILLVLTQPVMALWTGNGSNEVDDGSVRITSMPEQDEELPDEGSVIITGRESSVLDSIIDFFRDFFGIGLK